MRFNSKFSGVSKAALLECPKSICRVYTPSVHTHHGVLLNLHAPVKGFIVTEKKKQG